MPHEEFPVAEVTFQPVAVRNDCDDRDGRLVFVDGCLAAVIVRLDCPEHGGLVGSWFIEALFGHSQHPTGMFASLDAARDWMLHPTPAPRIAAAAGASLAS